MQRESSPESRAGSRALPDISALAASPSKTDHGAVNSAPLEALLYIVSNGHTLLADLLQISSSLPPSLRPQAVLEGRYAPILFDYRYFKDRDALEKKIEANADLLQLDEQFQEVHGGALQQLFNLFEQLVGMHASITDFLQHLEAGDFIQCTIDTLLITPKGKQLLCEALALLGTLLLALDRRLQGPVRERLVVAYYRLKGGSQAVGPSANAVIALCAATGLDATRRRSPAGYPEAYFGRMPLPQEVLLRLINTIRADDIYDQTVFFPAPEHRATALASQASLLYLLLCFSPQTLHRDGSLMRTLVDRHFADNWVVAWGPGFYTDLAMEWDSFRAARAALAGGVSVTRARDVAVQTAAPLPELQAQLAAHLSKGALHEEYVLEHMADILAALRNSNVSVRWLLLNCSGTQKKLKAAVASAAPKEDLLALLLEISQLENEVKQVYSKLLETKKERWTAQQAALKRSITGLGKFFTALQSLPQEDSPPDFSSWFEHLHQQVDAMHLEDPGGSSRRVQGVVAALNELERFHSGEASLQTAHYLTIIRGHLAHLLRLADVRPEMLHTLAAVSDFSYGWGLLDGYASQLQAQIRKQPATVGKLSSFFTKASSVMEMPLMRLTQANSKCLTQVSRYYSSVLLTFARRVLQVIPGSLWGLIDGMVGISTNRLEALGSKIEVTALRDAAQLEHRAALVSYAACIAALASGIQKIDRTSVGVLQLDAMQLMEDGLRQLLAMRIAGATASLLSFPQPTVPLLPGSPFRQQRGGLASVFGSGSGFSGEVPGRKDLSSRLVELSRRLEGVRQTVENVEDLVDLPGLQIWHQQMQAVISVDLARDVNQLKHRADGNSSRRQPENTPSPPLTFLGRVLGEVLRLSHPQRTQFHPLTGCWQDAAGNQLLSSATFRHVGTALSGTGISALNYLLGLRVQLTLEDIFVNLKLIDSGVYEGLQMLATAARRAETREGNAEGPVTFDDAAKKCASILEPLQEALLTVGQAQLLRRQLLLELRNMFMLDGAAQLGSSLGVLNSTILDQIKLGSQSTEGEPNAGIDVSQLAPLAEACGMEEPMERLFVPAAEVPSLPELLFLVILSASSHMHFERKSGMLLRRHKNAADSAILAVGMGTLLRQLIPGYLEAMLRLASRWVRSYVQAVTGSVAQGIEAAGIQVALPREVGTVLAFIAELGRFSHVPDGLVAKHIPFIYDTWLSVLD